MEIEQYDKNRLQEAYDLIFSVYSYYYDAKGYKKLVNRLATILNKLAEIADVEE